MSARFLLLCVALLILAGCGQIPPFAAPPPSQPPGPAPALSNVEQAGGEPPAAAALPAAAGEPAAAASASPVPPSSPTAAEPSAVASQGADDLVSGVAAAEKAQAAAAGSGTLLAAQIAVNPFSAAAPGYGEDNPLITLFPMLRTAPAPTWLAEGVRVTYFIQSAGPVPTGPDDTSTYGAGFMQYDLVSVQARAVRAAWKFYLSGSGGAITPSGAGISRGILGAGEYWVQPSVLRDAERVANDQLAVLHMPTTISGTTYQAVRFEYRPAGATYVWMFDASSGVLLFYRHTIGPEDNPRQTAQMIFQARRSLNVPWRGGSAPAWARGTTLRYAGTISVETFGSPTASFALSLSVEPQAGAAGYEEYSVSQYTSSQLSSQTERLTGAGQPFDGFWLSAKALQAAPRRGVLDRDPVTGSQVTIARGTDGSLTLTEAGQAYSTALTYDGRTGALQSMEQETTAGAITTRISVESVD